MSHLIEVELRTLTFGKSCSSFELEVHLPQKSLWGQDEPQGTESLVALLEINLYS